MRSAMLATSCLRRAILRPTSATDLRTNTLLRTNSDLVVARMTTSSANPLLQNGQGDQYKPFLNPSFYPTSSPAEDWTARVVSELTEAKQMHSSLPRPLRVLILYGSLRQRSFSKLMAFEAARILHQLGCEVKVYNPRGLPLKDDYDPQPGEDQHPKVTELRDLVTWSEAHFWCSPEQHGNLTGIFKTIIDHIPLSLGSVRPTQGKILAVSQVNGGSQSFNAVNSMRILGRWMRMFTVPNQASLPKAWTQFTEQGRMLESSNRERLVDVVEELVKVSCLFYGREETFASRWSERKETLAKGRLLSQAEKEAETQRHKEDAKPTPETI